MARAGTAHDLRADRWLAVARARCVAVVGLESLARRMLAWDGMKSITLFIAFLAGVVALGVPRTARGHCDGLDGPVVAAAREALRTGKVDLVLVWVPQKAEKEVRAAFTHTLAVRKLGAEARDLADTWFFETVVRVHRAGEGIAFTGLKPAGQELGQAIPAADKAIASGNVQPLVQLLTTQLAANLRSQFAEILELRAHRNDSLEAGRHYVTAYVAFIHYAQGAYLAATHVAEGHDHEDVEPVHKESVR